jgi:hypothetical protein
MLISKWTENRILVISSIKLAILNIYKDHSLKKHSKIYDFAYIIWWIIFN